MKVAVVGIGGVGGYLAGMLGGADVELTLVARGERKKHIEEEGLVLHSEKGFDAEQIEEFVERVVEVCDEEISVADILERARMEAGVDVSELGAI